MVLSTTMQRQLSTAEGSLPLKSDRAAKGKAVVEASAYEFRVVSTKFQALFTGCFGSERTNGNAP